MIKVSRMADYGVLILAQMAGAPEALRTTSDLSEATGLPEPTVAKILKILTGAAILSSVRGVNGGYRLLETPDRLSVASIITALDGPIRLTACADGMRDGCTLNMSCGLNGRWEKVNIIIRSALESMSLIDLLQTTGPQVPMAGDQVHGA
jgi:FeS assembly SUF system regulator